MGIELELVKIIRADPEVVWDFLVRTETWKSWWPDCVEAATEDDRRLEEGSRIELVLQPRITKVTLRPTVDLYSEGKTLSLTHRSALIQTTAAWYLSEKPDATVVKGELVFNGLLPFLVTIAQQSSAVRACFQRNLSGLKKAAERLV
ncbi:MAG: SRPBCC family protein [Thermoanaerobaculia bacterium]